MSSIITQLNILESKTLDNLRLSKSHNTLKSYKSDFKDFSIFCKKFNFDFLPTNPKTVSLYLTDLSKKLKYSTLKRRLISISVFHKFKGFYIDIKNPLITENLNGIKRNNGIKNTSKKPLLFNTLKNIINYLDELKGSNLKSIRDKAILLIGFSGGFRRSEIARINYEDLEFVQEGLKIQITRSKTDQFGEGTVKGIPYFDNKKYCPVLNLKNYLKLTNIKTGALFRRFRKNNQISSDRLTDQSIALIIKFYLNKIGIEQSMYSGHSLRSGFATSVAEAGADERSIMNMTGHRTTQMVRRYIKEANLFKNNALKKLNT